MTNKKDHLNEIIINVNSLGKSFGSIAALEDINFSVKKGEFFGLIGADAAGKTTLLRIIAGIMDFNKGTVEVFQKDIVKETQKIQNDIGYMPQKFGLYEDLTVMENINLYASIKGSSDLKKQQEMIDRLLNATRLKDFTSRLAGALSGGMKQKLALCCTMLGNPKLLLLDEVSVGVDPLSRKELIGILLELIEEGTTVVWSTSFLDEAEICTNILLIHEGKKIFQGTPKSFKERTKNKVFLLEDISSSKIQNRNTVLELLKFENISDVTVCGKSFRTLLYDKNYSIFDEKKFKIQKIDSKIEDSFLDALSIKLISESKIAKSYSTKKYKKEEILIKATNITKKFGDFTAVNNISFEVKRGEIFGLLGPNGAGKSTTFKMLCGLIKPTSGSTSICGIDLLNIDHSEFARARVGYMAQKFSLYSEMTVMENLKFFSGVYGLKDSFQEKAISAAIDSVDIKKFLNVRTESLALGIKQKLALVCSVMHNPDVLFLDEPTSGADPVTRKEFWIHINSIVQKGVSIVLTTHFMEEAEYCDRVAIIYQGKKLIEDRPQEIRNYLGVSNFEDAFIEMIKRYDENNKKSNTK